jgi:hypothetical protein
MRKSILVALAILVLAVPVYAVESHWGEEWFGSADWGLKVSNLQYSGKGFFGLSANTEGNGIGVQGESRSRSGRGVYGLAKRGGGKTIGVYGQSTSNQGKGVMGFASKASGPTYGVYGRVNSPNGWGLYTPNRAYVGKLSVGTLTPSAKLDVVGTTELNGDVDINSDLDVDGGTLHVNGTTNRVGIGTTSPGAKLEVASSANNDTPGEAHKLRFSSGSGIPYFGFRMDEGNTHLVLDRQSGGNWKGVLAVRRSNGRIGIGTRNPSARLDVVGNTELNGDVDINSDLDVDDGTLHVNGTTDRVGIGTTSPSAKLDVEVLSGGAATIGSSNNSATGDFAVAMGYNTVASGHYSSAMGRSTVASGHYSSAMGREIEAAGDYSVAIALNDQNGAVVSQDNTMAIMGGKVGIGTTSPLSKFAVSGLPTSPPDGSGNAGVVCVTNNGNFWLDADGTHDCV